MYNLTMLKLSASINELPVLSLRTGAPVGQTAGVIIDPNNLMVEGWYVSARPSDQKLVLLKNEVRDIAAQGILINDFDDLSHPDDLVRLKPIMKINFQLLDKLVTTESGKRVGKVSDYAVETEAMMIKKIYVAQSIIKNFSGGSLVIDRNQITEISDKRIVVEDPTETTQAPAVATA